MDSHRQIAVIAPKQLAGAFSVLIHSAPNLDLLASAAGLDELRTILGENKPDVFLIYLVEESGLKKDKPGYEIITRLKSLWPEGLCVAIVKYAPQLARVKECGADLALVDGVNGERLLSALGGKIGE